MKQKIIKAEDLPKDAKVFLKKEGDSYRVIHPIKNEDGTLNWFNILTGGSWRNVILVSVIIIILLGLLYEYSSNMQILLDCFKDNYHLQICKEGFGLSDLSSTISYP